MICFYKAEAKSSDIAAKIAKSIDNTATESYFFNLFCAKYGHLARLWIPFCLFCVSGTTNTCFMEQATLFPNIVREGLLPIDIFWHYVHVLTRVRDKLSMKIVLTALIVLHIQAVPPAYSQKSNMQ